MAVDAFKALQQRSPDRAGPVFVTMEGEPLQGYKHWFEPAVRDGKTKCRQKCLQAKAGCFRRLCDYEVSYL